MMTISYDNTLDDACAWYAYYLYQTRIGKRAIRQRRIRLAALRALFTFCFAFWVFGSPWLPLIIALAVTGLVSLTDRSMEQSSVTRETRRMEKEGFFRVFMGRKEVSLQPDGVHTTFADGHIVRHWKALQRWTSTETHLVLHYSDDDYQLIPLRAFGNQDHARLFLERLEEGRSGQLAAAVPIPAIATPNAVTSPTMEKAATTPQMWWRDRNSVGDTGEVRTTTLNAGSGNP